MFIHFLAGALIFLWGGCYFGMKVSQDLLILGAFWGFLPDMFSVLWQEAYPSGKYFYRHRDNLSHSIFFPLLFWGVYLGDGRVETLLAALAISSHPILDLFGIGWGVKLLWPFSKKTLKLFYGGKFAILFSPEKLDDEVMKYGMDDWVKRVYFTFDPVRISRWWGVMDWLSLFAFFALLALY